MTDPLLRSFLTTFWTARNRLTFRPCKRPFCNPSYLRALAQRHCFRSQGVPKAFSRQTDATPRVVRNQRTPNKTGHPKLCETDRFRRFVCDLCIDRGQKQISGLRTCQNRGRTPARREIPWHTWSDPGHFCCGVSPSLLQIHRFAVECLRFSLEIPQGTPACFTMTILSSKNSGK